MNWTMATRVLMATDCICLLFERRDGSPAQIFEEWQGFAELFNPVSASFPSIPANWYADVMSPAFE